MKFKSEDQSKPVESENDELVFFDIEVFPNLFLVNWKYQGEDKKVVRMINPSPKDIEELMKFKLIGFNCRRYDNWDSQSLTISKTIINPASTGTSRVQNSPKSLSSRRVIPISSTCYEILTMLRNQNGSIHVLGTGDRRMSYKAFVKHTKSFCWKAGIPYKGTHVFRHTFATNCYYRGCNVKLLSKLLGHANPSITYAIYINLYGDALEEMRSVLG